MISPEHAEILRNWKEREFVDPKFDFEELTEHYMENLLKMVITCLITFM